MLFPGEYCLGEKLLCIITAFSLLCGCAGNAGSYRNAAREAPARHLGLYNVDAILLKYYDEGFGLEPENSPENGGAVITATVPVRRKEPGG